MPATASHRLTYLGVPVAFHAGIVARRAPRFHTLVHLTIILASIAAAVAAITAWSQHVETAADDAAKAAHAVLYDSDIGAEFARPHPHGAVRGGLALRIDHLAAQEARMHAVAGPPILCMSPRRTRRLPIGCGAR